VAQTEVTLEQRTATTTVLVDTITEFLPTTTPPPQDVPFVVELRDGGPGVMVRR